MVEFDKNKKVLLIVGPTAVGKTRLSLKLAETIPLEVVSADSRQIYRYMDIGTAKPTREEQQLVAHHFIDIKNPDEYYSAGKYGKEAREKIAEVFARGKLPVVVGGSGLYIRALVDGLFDAEIYDQQVKQSLRQRVKQKGLAKLYEYLKSVDPVLAKRLHPNDTQRILRALEVWEITGTPLSRFQQQQEQKANFDPVFIGLTMTRTRLYERIENRVDDMLEKGFMEEVEQLAQMGYSEELVSLQTVGYKEAFEYLKGNINYERMVELIKQKTRNYAKRQLTWFKKDTRINWINIDSDVDEKVKILLDFLQKKV